MHLAKIYGSILKVEDQEDGTIKVFGVASSEARDNVGEIVSAGAMKAALPDYEKFPALREMHQPLAAGKVIEADVDEAGVTHICAHVVDPIAIVKVRTGVYAGFSIGGKVLKRDPDDRSIITSLKLIEISLVDSPCNPDAILTMWKADAMTEFKPASEDVIARAKTLAKAAGTKRFKDYLFEASQELISEHLLKNGELEEPQAAQDEPAAEPAAEPKEASAQADEPPASDPPADPPLEPAAEPKEAAAQPGDASADPPADPGAGEPAGEAEDPANKVAAGDEPAEVDPAAALADALSKAGDAIEAAAAPADEAGPDLFADFGKAAIALRGLGVGLAKSEAVAEGAEFVVPASIEKCLWHVSRFADLLESLGYLQQSVASEANWEGDASAVPGAIADGCRTLGAALVAMVQEEVAEFLSQIIHDEEPVIEVIYAGEGIELAGQIVDLVKANAELMEKAGARNSSADLERIQQSHDHMAKLGAKCDKANCEGDEDADKAAQIETLESENERLNKALGDGAAQVEDITKRFTETVDGLKGQIEELGKRFSELDQTPLPPKTAGPAATRLVEKGQDSAGGAGQDPTAGLSDEQFEKAWEGLSEKERGEILLRAALARPQYIASR